MAKRGRRTKGLVPMTGAERQRQWRLKTFGEKPKRKAMTGAERQQRLRNVRKVAKIREMIIREAQEIAATADNSFSTPLIARRAAYLFRQTSTKFGGLRAQDRTGKPMTAVTYYVALPFVAADDGIAAGEPTECSNPGTAVMRAEALSRKEGQVGAVAFSRTGDPAMGDFSDAKVIRNLATCRMI